MSQHLGPTKHTWNPFDQKCPLLNQPRGGILYNRCFFYMDDEMICFDMYDPVTSRPVHPV